MAAELKSCPFCGGEAVLCKDLVYDGNSYKTAIVKCKDCGCNTGAYIIDGYWGIASTVQDAINAWNRRAEPNTLYSNSTWRASNACEAMCMDD